MGAQASRRARDARRPVRASSFAGKSLAPANHRRSFKRASASRLVSRPANEVLRTSINAYIVSICWGPRGAWHTKRRGDAACGRAPCKRRTSTAYRTQRTMRRRIDVIITRAGGPCEGAVVHGGSRMTKRKQRTPANRSARAPKPVRRTVTRRSRTVGRSLRREIEAGAIKSNSSKLR